MPARFSKEDLIVERTLKAGVVALLAFGLGCGVSPSMPLSETHPAHAGADETPFAADVGGLRMVPEVGSRANVSPEPLRGDYPLDVCLVSGKKLGSMGKPLVLRVEGRELRLCCPGCEDRLRESLPTYLKKLDKASSGDRGKSSPAPSKPRQEEKR